MIRKYISLLMVLVLLVQPVTASPPPAHEAPAFMPTPTKSVAPLPPVPEVSIPPIATPSPEPVVAPAPVTSSYPSKWANAPLDTVVDDWGNYNRECVSYTAWKVASSGRHMPAWWANAKDWLGKAALDGIPTGATPRVGSVGITTAGQFGHAVYVEAVYGNGTILISQYNAVPGEFSTEVQPASNYTYIYF